MEVGGVFQMKPVVHLEEMSMRLQEKYPDLDLLSEIQKRLNSLKEPLQLDTTTTQAIAVSLACPIHLDGLQEKDPSFEAWKRASYKFLCQEFGKENLVYLHLNQYKSIYDIHCVFVPIRSNQLDPRAFVGRLTHYQGYTDRYHALLDDLARQAPCQANGLPGRQTPKAAYDKSLTGSSTHNRFYGSVDEALKTIERMDLVEYFIEEHGYQLNKQKTSVKWPRLDHPNGEKLLLHQDKGIHYYESLNDEEDKGTIVKYLLRRGCKNKDEVLAKVLGEYLSKEHYKRLNQKQTSPEEGQSSDDSSRDPALYQKEAQAEFDKFFRHCYGETYLEQRGIEPATYQGIQGIKTNFLGAIFCLYTAVDIEGQGKLCSTIKYFPGEERSKKYCQKGLPRGLSVIKPSGEIKEIFITESPIDALSHKQLYGTKHTLYLSTCGSIKKEIARNLEAIFIQAKKQRVVVKLGFDGDEKGREMAEQIAEIARKQGITFKMEFPEGVKDWNNMLVAHLKKSPQLNQPKHAAGLVA